MTRLVIVGGPRTGKTTWADSQGAALGVPVRHTDDLIGVLDWSAASAEVATWLDADGDWIVEGVTTVRALRKWLAANPDKRLDAKIVLFTAPRVEQTPAQAAMSKGVDTVWREIETELAARGIAVEDARS